MPGSDEVLVSTAFGLTIKILVNCKQNEGETTTTYVVFPLFQTNTIFMSA